MKQPSIRFYIYVLILFLAVAAVSCAEDPQVFITETGEKYHRDGCRYLERSRIPIRLSTAVSLGYDPCGYCNPPPPPPPPPEIIRPGRDPGLYRLNAAGLEHTREADLTEMIRAVVVRHVDGDTVYVAIPRPPRGVKKYESVRFIGVDTPETVHPQKTVERFGKEASDFTRDHLLNQPVFLAFDWQLRDRYDRLLAYVYLADGSCFNAVLVKDGYAHAYTRFPFQFLEEFRSLERSARERGEGLWGSDKQP